MKTVPRFLNKARSESRGISGQELWLPPPTSAGIVITPRVAMSVAAFFSAINVISTDVASLSRRVYRRLPNGGKQYDPEYAVNDLVQIEPNEETSNFRFTQSLVAHSLMYGNGYAEIQVRGDGRPFALHLLDSERTSAKRRDDGSLYYDLGEGRTLPPSRMLHFAGLGYDSITGYRLIDIARDAIGLNKAAEIFGMSFFGNGTFAGGFLETPNTLKPEARKNLRESWEALHRGPDKAHRTAVLENGVKFSKSTVDPESAQFLETRKFQILEIARIFRIPPHKLGDYSESHLANLEEANLDYLQTTLMPWLEMSEQEMNRKLIRREDRKSWFIEHNMESLLRGNSAARSTFNKDMFGIGVFSRNDIAARENLNPVDGGEKHYVPLNMGTIESNATETDTAKDGTATADVQATALNGAQVTSLQLIVTAVTVKQLPAASAKAMLAAAFPNFSAEQINAMVDSAAAFEPQPKATDATDTPQA